MHSYALLHICLVARLTTRIAVVAARSLVQFADAWQKSVPMLRPAPSHQVRSTAMFVTAPAIPEMEGTGEEEEAGAPLRDNRSAGVPLSTSDVASPFQAHSDSDFEPNTRQAPISPTSKGLSPGLRDPAAMPV